MAQALSIHLGIPARQHHFRPLDILDGVPVSYGDVDSLCGSVVAKVKVGLVELVGPLELTGVDETSNFGRDHPRAVEVVLR